MKTHRILSIILAVMLVIGLISPLPTSIARADDAPPAIDPAFLQHIQEHPDDVFAVIVQKAQNNGNRDLKQEVTNGGGNVKKELDFITSFSAELSGREIEKLARHPLTRWISYDAPMFSTAVTSESFTTWATAVGTVTTNTFTSNTLMVDSSLGGNGSYGYGATVKGAFTGFSGQYIPGNAITNVELVLKGYVPTILGAGADPVISVWVNGVQSKTGTLNHHGFDAYVGAANAGLVYFDITSLRSWKWADFESNLQIMINQSKFGKTSVIYYDAIGLRVTSAPGTTPAWMRSRARP